MLILQPLSIGSEAIENLENALNFWSRRFNEIVSLLTMSPSAFQGGDVWRTVTSILDVFKATGVSLLIIFFFYGLFKAGIDYHDVFRNPKAVIMAFVRIAVAQFFVVHALDFLAATLYVGQGLIAKVPAHITAASFTIPANLRSALEGADWWAGIGALVASYLGYGVIALLSIIVLMVVYGRFFKIFLLTAIAPIPLAGLASEATASIGQNFIKSYFAECLRGVLVIVACVIFTAFAHSPATGSSTSPGAMTFWYVSEVVLQMLLLVVMAKGSDRMVKEIFGI